MSRSIESGPAGYVGAHRTSRWRLRRTNPTTTAEAATAVARAKGPRRWTAQDIRALGATTDLPTAGRILGISHWSVYRIHRAGQFPVPVVQVGRRLRVPVAPLLDLLGLHRWPDQS
ncbi:hypothetical protein GCM10010124_36740 [Pilimelia terevasa]|uniref:Helix-turn-helix domain-containing protein n=1 Tax=Pilimelia terevasa TaxID=53372 RepID=A0A8J3BTV6_9ACTN|nr:hypothetical protein [Pilimelia terevasa]GGK40604.1 hypothetical protein GCM10010124_36740 [Pilimelia terevasa]